MNGTPVSFNTNSLQNDWIFTQLIDHENIPTKVATAYILAHANGSIIPFTEYSGKTVVLKGKMIGAGIADMDNKLDIFRGYFNVDAKNLDIGYGGKTRRYIATMVDLKIDRPGGLAWAEFELTFLCVKAFGQDTDITTLVSALNMQTAPRTDSVLIGGSAPQQVPIVTIKLNNFTGSGLQTISWGNNNTGQQLSIARTWTANDIIQIDCSTYDALVNGLPVDYTGAFVELPPGPQSIGLSDSFSQRSYDYNVGYYKRYM